MGNLELLHASLRNERGGVEFECGLGREIEVAPDDGTPVSKCAECFIGNMTIPVSFYHKINEVGNVGRNREHRSNRDPRSSKTQLHIWRSLPFWQQRGDASVRDVPTLADEQTMERAVTGAQRAESGIGD